MKKPKTQEQLCLYLLLKNKVMTPLKFIENGLISYHQRIGDLRSKDINVLMKKVSFENQFGNKSEHGTWYLSNKIKAQKLYKELTK